MKKIAFIVLLAVLQSSCTDSFPDYTERADDVFVRLHEFGEDTSTVCSSHFVKLQIQLQNFYGSQDYWLESEYQKLSSGYMGNGGLGQMICDLHQGDSVSYVLPYGLMKESLWDEYSVDERLVPDTSMMLLTIDVDGLLNENEYALLMQNRIQAGMLKENDFLHRYLDGQGLIDDYTFHQDVYFSKLLVTQGVPITFGSTIEVDYKSYFLDGTEFDNSLTGNSTMWFVLGKPDQVVDGMEIAISAMNDGEVMRVYVPSHMGFGQSGSTTGVVPSLTSVYFDVSAKLFNAADSLSSEEKGL